MLVKALIAAAQQGVTIDLVIRGACILPVDAPGVNGRIHIRSIVGRFLEHSRVFYFEINPVNGKQVRRMWLSSADWMSRNMIRRVEIAWPILNAAMQNRVLEECLLPYLEDTEDAWVLAENGTYQQLDRQNISHSKRSSTQKKLIQAYTR